MEKSQLKSNKNEDSKKPNVIFNYVSCIKIDGVPILPPLLTEKDREEMRYYRQLAINVQNRIKKFKELYLTDISSGETDIPDENFSTTESSDNYFTDISYEDSIMKFSESCQKDILSMLEDEKTRTNSKNDNSSNDTSNDITPISDIPVPSKEEFVSEIKTVVVSSDENYATANETLDCDKTPHKLIRSNSFILENPSPLLMAQIEQQKLLLQKQNSPPKRKTWDTTHQTELFSQRSSEDNILSQGIENKKMDCRWLQTKRRSFEDQKRLKSAPNSNKKAIPYHKRKGWDLSNAKEKWTSIENDIGKTRYKITKKFNSLPSSTTSSPNEKMFISRKNINNNEPESEKSITQPPKVAKTPPNLIKTPDLTKNVPKRLLIMSTPKKNTCETKKIRGFVTPVRTIQDLNNIPSRENSPKRARSAPRNFLTKNASTTENCKTAFTIKRDCQPEFLAVENDRDMGDSLKINKAGVKSPGRISESEKNVGTIDLGEIKKLAISSTGFNHKGLEIENDVTGVNFSGRNDQNRIRKLSQIDGGIPIDQISSPKSHLERSDLNTVKRGIPQIRNSAEIQKLALNNLGFDQKVSEVELNCTGTDFGVRNDQFGMEIPQIERGIPHIDQISSEKCHLERSNLNKIDRRIPFGATLGTLDNINSILTPERELPLPLSNAMNISENNELKNLFVKIQEIQKRQMDELLEKQKREQEIFLQKFAEQQTLLLTKISKNYSTSENHIDDSKEDKIDLDSSETEKYHKNPSDLFEASETLLTECKRLLAPPKSNCYNFPLPQSTLCSYNSSDTLNDPNLTLRSDTDQSVEEITIKYKNSNSNSNSPALATDFHVVTTAAEYRRSVSTDSLETQTFLSNSVFNGSNFVARVEKNVLVKVDCRRELFPSSEQVRAATIICAAARGYLVRKLLKTEKVQTLIQTIKDTLLCAMELHHESVENILPADIELHRRLIQQVTAACVAFHDMFFKLSTKEQMSVIFHDRERLKEKLLRPISARSSASTLSVTTQKVLERKHRRENSYDFGTHSNRSSFSRSSRSQTVEPIRPRTRSAGPIDSQQFKKTPPNSQENSLRKTVGIGANKKPWR